MSQVNTSAMRLAVVREEECIGCNKCVPACPVDAILGAPKFIHTVLKDVCIGCQLCVAPCPVDCIEMVDLNASSLDKATRANNAKHRYLARQQRLALKQKPQIPHFSQDPAFKHKIKQEIQDAVARVSERKAHGCKTTSGHF